METREAQDILVLLLAHLSEIKHVLGEESWQMFIKQLRTKAALFEHVADEAELEDAVDQMLDVVFDKGTIQRIIGPAWRERMRGTPSSGPAPQGDLVETYHLLCTDAEAFIQPPSLNTRFFGVEPDQPLPVGRRVPLHIWVGLPVANSLTESSRPFEFAFPEGVESVAFTVRVDADPESWIVETEQPVMIVARSGATRQMAQFFLTAKHVGRDKLHISVEQAGSGATVQHIWLPVAADTLPGAGRRVEASLPLDAGGIRRRAVEIVIQPAQESYQAVVRADLPGGMVRATYRVPISVFEVQQAAQRLRQELQCLVRYTLGAGDEAINPFYQLSINKDLARRTMVPLAKAGQGVWRKLFQAPRAPEGLTQFAKDLRALPDGSSFQIVLNSEQFIIPWALLYDKPGPIDEATLDWTGFWGYRYQLDVLPPGRYPDPAIRDSPPEGLLLFSDDFLLYPFVAEQQEFVERELTGMRWHIVRGDADVQRILAQPGDVALIYCYCHGERAVGAPGRTALPGESALYFSQSVPVRMADLQDLPIAPLNHRPLVFLNTCEGAAQDAFSYDGFMPYFVETLGARGFIGTEVQVPVLLAHDVARRFLVDFALGRPVGEILWKLRRHYLDTGCNILGFNYSLYCLGEVCLAPQLGLGC